MALEAGRKIIQLDEFAINKFTWLNQEWSLPKTNVEINRGKTYNEPYSVILAISREKGVELVDI